MRLWDGNPERQGPPHNPGCETRIFSALIKAIFFVTLIMHIF